MRLKMVDRIKELFGLSGPSCKQMREERDKLAETIEIKHESIIAKRRERANARTGEIPAAETVPPSA